MRLILGVGLAALLLPGAASGAPVPAGDFHARLRANDAPLGGRFTVRAYALDTLATAVELPGPGRLVILNVREANGDDSFLIPGDFGIQGDRTVWMRGFQPLGEGPFEGLLGKRDSRWALWWVPWESDSLVWSSFEGIRLAYGIWTAPFTSLDAEDAAEVRRRFRGSSFATCGSIRSDRRLFPRASPIPRHSTSRRPCGGAWIRCIPGFPGNSTSTAPCTWRRRWTPRDGSWTRT